MFGLKQLSLLAGSLVGVVTLLAGCTCGTPYEGDYFDGDRPEALKGIAYKEGEKGDPKVVGCADGQREGFADAAKFPRVAGCVGNWIGSKSLRDKSTTKACGDDGAQCDAPADVCAPGWHVCGIDGKASDLKERVPKVKDCHNAGPGRFNAAMSHGQTDELCPPKPTPQTVFPCTQAGIGSEPVCCGNDCLYGKCKDGVWTGKTKISRGTTEGCGAVTADRNAGILCCADGGEAVPAGAGADAKAEGGEAGAEGKADDTKDAEAKADGAEADKKKAADKPIAKKPANKDGEDEVK